MPAAVLVAIAAAWFGWRYYAEEPLPAGIARGNGRIEGVEIDVATRIAGRIRDILVNEGDVVSSPFGNAELGCDTTRADAGERAGI